MQDAVIEDGPARRSVYVFADETGKTSEWTIVGAVWVLTGRAVFTTSRAIDRWQSASPWASREVHFARFGRDDLAVLPQYLDVIQENREFLSFKTIATERARLRRRIDEVVCKLHEYMLIRGVAHELETGRLELPQGLEVTVDEEQSLDRIALLDFRRGLSDHFRNLYGDGLEVTGVASVSSRTSEMIQLADVVAGSVSRRRNHRGDRNFKDDMADMVIDRLGLQFEDVPFPDIDSSVWMSL